LNCGIAAGPLFLAVWARQAFNREGFEPGRHPASLLALGDQFGFVAVVAARLRRGLHVERMRGGFASTTREKAPHDWWSAGAA
jgi:hypothetical protein